MLREAAAHLTTGGHILISYPSLIRVRPVIIRLARIVGALWRSDWRLEPGDLVVRYGSFYRYEHAFEPEEIETEAAAAGLRVVYRRDSPDDPVVSLVADSSAGNDRSRLRLGFARLVERSGTRTRLDTFRHLH
jgi:hypothetical protein